MKILAILCCGLSLVSGLAAESNADQVKTEQAVDYTFVPTAVNIDINTRSYTFETKPRLAEVLAPIALEQDWYWPGSKLYRLDNPDGQVSAPEQLRSTVLQQLQAFSMSAEPAVQIELMALRYQVASWTLATRVLIPINYDLARAQAAFNPRFDAGAYKLQLVERPEQVHFWGAVTQRVTTPHSGATAIADYMAAIERSAAADGSTVYVIQPDGTVTKAGVASWNRQHIEAMPGAEVFIPFATEWFGVDIDSLNQNLLALALYRVAQ